MKKRLDQELVDRDLVKSREKAKYLISNNLVLVNKKLNSKKSAKVDDLDDIELIDNFNYVSRAGYKLEEANSYLDVNFKNKVVVDMGCSVGGFTHYSVINGAKKIYSIDTGDNLDEKLKLLDEVEYHPNTDINDFKLKDEVDIVLIDVTFQYPMNLLNLAKPMLKSNGYILFLFKPNFTNENFSYLEENKAQEKLIQFLEDIKYSNLAKELDYKKLDLKGKEKGQREYFLKIKV